MWCGQLSRADHFVIVTAFVTGAMCAYGMLKLVEPVTCSDSVGQPGAGAQSRQADTGAIKKGQITPSADDSVRLETLFANSSSGNKSNAVRSFLLAQFTMMDRDMDGFLDSNDIHKIPNSLEFRKGYIQKLHRMIGDQEVSFDDLKVIRGWLKLQFELLDVDMDGTLDSVDIDRFTRKMELAPSYAWKFQKSIGTREMNFSEFKAAVKQFTKIESITSRIGMPRETPLVDGIRSSIIDETLNRASVLLLLMVLQSGSAMVLDRYKELIQDHVIIMLFLTMLVGAGGNCGNQSTIYVIELLISGRLKLTASACAGILWTEFVVGSLLAILLGAGGFVRAYFTHYHLRPPGDDGVQAFAGCIAVTASLMVIVATSALLGTCLPLLFALAGVDAAHAGPTIQVVMDIGGVVITCSIARLLLTKTCEYPEDVKLHAAHGDRGEHLSKSLPRALGPALQRQVSPRIYHRSLGASPTSDYTEDDESAQAVLSATDDFEESTLYGMPA